MTPKTITKSISPKAIADLEDRIQEELLLSEVTQKTKLHKILWEFYDQHSTGELNDDVPEKLQLTAGDRHG